MNPRILEFRDHLVQCLCITYNEIKAQGKKKSVTSSRSDQDHWKTWFRSSWGLHIKAHGAQQ